ncbi:Spore germination protein A1 [Clostridium liquoris]|jgi:spore germination protein KA/spore germination protein|uniref:Spore germination protein A1 n=1 Tax=Clostridium liquoris TaxID=1289519 RepID=A0A2T0B6D8_9CLOT|nr:spore germination protein [Clostridium liquoris]PRR79357.1 Spore germination protein A1 [Clostridium liquoris]
MLKNKSVLNIIEELSKSELGITIRKLYLCKCDYYILYISEITDRNSISNYIIKPLLYYKDSASLDIKYIAESIITIDNLFIDNDINNINDYIVKGNSIILSTKDTNYIVANTYKVSKRSLSEPELQTDLKGPKDSFTENFESNISLIRYRLKDSRLNIYKTTVGERTKSSVAVIYLKDVADSNLVNSAIEKINNIKIDGIMESGYLQKYLQEKFSLFPQTGIVERSDAACSSLLKGKVCIVVEGGNLPIIIPQTFWDFVDAGDDHYKLSYFSIFLKSIRIFSLILSLTLSSLYVAVVSFHPDILPTEYILTLAEARATVPINAFLEAFLLEIVAEILKEASLRLPKQVGSAIGIVGTIVIGQASVSAGLVSPLMVIIVALSTMTSFILPDYTIMSSFRVLKFFLLIFTGAFGLFGLVVGMTFIIINLVSTMSFSTPYSSPMIPIDLKAIRAFFLSDIRFNNERPSFFYPKDKKRK